MSNHSRPLPPDDEDRLVVLFPTSSDVFVGPGGSIGPTLSFSASCCPRIPPDRCRRANVTDAAAASATMLPEAVRALLAQSNVLFIAPSDAHPSDLEKWTSWCFSSAHCRRVGAVSSLTAAALSTGRERVCVVEVGWHYITTGLCDNGEVHSVTTSLTMAVPPVGADAHSRLMATDAELATMRNVWFDPTTRKMRSLIKSAFRGALPDAPIVLCGEWTSCHNVFHFLRQEVAQLFDNEQAGSAALEVLEASHSRPHLLPFTGGSMAAVFGPPEKMFVTQNQFSQEGPGSIHWKRMGFVEK